MNNFPVDYVVIYINWDKTSLFTNPRALPILNAPIKIQPSSGSYLFLIQF